MQTCADPEIFAGGGGGGGVQVNLTKKALTTFFFFLFFFKTSAYFAEVKWLISKKTIIVRDSRRGPTFSRGWGGVQLFLGGLQFLIPLRNPYDL